MRESAEKALVIILIAAVIIGAAVLIFDNEYRIPAIIASNSTYYKGVTDEDIKEHSFKYDSIRKYKKKYKKKKDYKAYPEKVKTVNINKARKSELTQIHGITSSIATKIIFYRKIHKGFKSKQELLKIPGITQEKYNLIQQNITIK